VIIERAMNDDWLSNTYLVADELGSHAVMIDAGGPVEPLLRVLERMRFQLTHVLLTHHHRDHVSELERVRERWPDTAVLIHPAERDEVPGATGTMSAGEVISSGALEIEPIHTPGHTAGMLSLLVGGTDVFPGHTDPSTVADELEHNPFVRIWRGVDPEGTEPCTAMGQPATLILWAEDYDGGHKAWVRWQDGADDIVPGSQIER
jgi:hydroxyacylglutathione hydrolase